MRLLVMVNVIRRMKANTSIIEKESIRFLINLSQLFLGTAFIPQIEFNELCISAKIVVAPKIEIPKLTKAADLEESVFSAFSIIERRASVTSGPTIGCSWT